MENEGKYMSLKRDLHTLAHQAQKERKKHSSCLIGYCYENAEEMSRQLYENNIPHKLHKVGIITDIVQFSEYTYNNIISDESLYKDCVYAAETGEYREHVPKTTEEVPMEANHYIIIVPHNNQSIVVEPCSEVRNNNFGDIYVGEWPTKDYLPLKDSKISKESRFDHF